MTGHEISCFVKYNLKPIVFVLNNKGYTTQRFLKDGSFNDIQDWNYHLFPQIFGSGLGLQVGTESELEEALGKAQIQHGKLYYSECIILIIKYGQIRNFTPTYKYFRA